MEIYTVKQWTKVINKGETIEYFPINNPYIKNDKKTGVTMERKEDTPLTLNVTIRKNINELQ